MRNILKILLVLLVVAMIVLVASYLFLKPKICNTKELPPVLQGVWDLIPLDEKNNETADGLKITNINAEYGQGEDIIVAGEAGPGNEVFFLWNKRIGQAMANKKGLWIANLGKMPEGEYSFEVFCDTAGRRDIATAIISVVKSNKTASLIGKISNFFAAGLSFVSQSNPKETIMIPLDGPQVMGGQWELVND